MLEVERRRILLEFVQERAIVSVPDIARMLRVSPITVRRDMNALAAAGLLRRVRGGAQVLIPRTRVPCQNPFTARRDSSFFQKRAIARAATALIDDNDAVMINGGTTTYAMAEFLRDRTLSILTNSLPFATALLSSRNRIVMPGGAVYPEENLVLSFDDDGNVEHFPGRTVFTSCYGINRLGLMESDPLVLQAGTQLLKRAERIVVLADSDKLRQRTSAITVGLSRIHTLITDADASDAQLQVFRDAGIKVIRTSSEIEDHPSPPPRARAPLVLEMVRSMRESE